MPSGFPPDCIHGKNYFHRCADFPSIRTEEFVSGFDIVTTTSYMIKQFGVLSVAKFSAVIGLIWGFVMGLVVALGAGSMAAVMGAPLLGVGAGFAGLIIMIILGGIFGFVGGAVIAFVYNIVLGFIGGIEMDLELKAPEAKP
jgi:hypothetical protein